METTYRLAGGEVEIPVMGLGTWAWGDRQTWGMGGYDPSYGLDTIREAYARSVASGVTLLDTAEVYGQGESERIIARLLEENPQDRNRIVVATKFLPLPWRIPMRQALLDALRKSLERLRLPRVQLYQLHGPVSLRRHDTMAEALAKAKSEGLIEAIGVSNYSARETRAMHQALSRQGLALATNQVEYSLLRTSPARSGLVATCEELGVRILAYSPIGQGRLTGKYGPGNPPPGDRTFSAYPMEEIEPLLVELRRLGQVHGGKTPSQVALNWLIGKGVVPIPGAKNGAQAEENAGALGWRLSADDMANLDRLALPGQRTLYHRLWQHG